MDQFVQKLANVGMDISKTRTELEEISDLNFTWAGKMSSLLDELQTLNK